MRYFSRFAILVVCAVCISSSVLAQRAGEEITYPSKSFAKLDTFEGLNLEDADKVYGKKDYKGAYASYKAFSFEFAKSRALPYVLLRMARCLHQLDKRNAAITAYKDVVDYFPDDVRYAAAALYYIGVCHQQNGDIDKQTAVWARMVKDDDYVAQPNSGSALIHLAAAMDKLEKSDEAVEYRWRTAVNFAQSNVNAARAAVAAVIDYYAARRPNHDKLKEFYTLTGGFGNYRGKFGNPQEDARYWNTVFDYASRAPAEIKPNSCRYWVGKFGKLFPKDDNLRRKLFNLQLAYENDKDAWAARMGKQFAQTPATVGRVADWVGHFGVPAQQLEFAMKHGGPLMGTCKPKERMNIIYRMRWNRDKFYAKWVQPTLKSMKPDERVWLMNELRRHGLHNEAQAVLRSINLAGMTDKQIRDIGMFAGNYLTPEDVIRYFAKMKDKLAAAKARFDYYGGDFNRHIRDAEKALGEIPGLKKSPKYAGQDLAWKEAILHRKLGNYEQAIKAYRAANKQPDSTWAVTDCLIAMKNYPGAIKNVQGLESVKATASAACMKIADIYKIAGDKGKEVEQLRLVMRRYPKTGQSSQAHQRLESYGVKLIGGESKAVE